MSARSNQIAVLALAGAVIAASVAFDGDSSVVTIFGQPVPTLCVWRQLTGLRCPGCGLTRSFVYMGGGHPLDALRTHILGPAMWIFVAAQIPYRMMRLWGDRARSPRGSWNARQHDVSE